MGISCRFSRILAVLLIAGWIPAAASAFTPGEFIVSPRQIDMGTIRVAPGASAGPFSFMVSVVGGPVPDAGETNTFFLSTDASWLSVTQESNEVPGNAMVSVNIPATLAEGFWQANVKITSGLDPSMAPVVIPVSMRLIRSTGDFLTISPSGMDLVVSDSNAADQTFPVSITNADPDRTVFDWSARPGASWVTLSAYSGSGNGTVQVTVNPGLVPLSEDLDGDGIPDGATATVTFRSNLNTDPVVLTVRCRIAISGFTPGVFTVSPSQIDLGTLRVAPGGTAGPFSFNISVLGGPLPKPGSNRTTVFFPSTDAPWISLSASSATSPGIFTATVNITDTMEGEYEAEIVILSGLDPGMAPVSIPVRVTVVRTIENRLTVSPSSLDLVVPDQNASQQLFPVQITNTDPNRTDYDWSAQSDVLWLTLSQSSGTGNSEVTLTVDPKLMNITEDLDGDGIPDGAVGTITVRSSLNAEAAVLTVTLRVEQGPVPDFIPGNFNVSPRTVDFGIIRALPGASAGPFSLTVSVVGGPVPNAVSGGAADTATFFAVSDKHWLSVTPAEGVTPGTVTASLNVTETMPEGDWQANIIITSGLDTAMSPLTIPVTMTLQRRLNDELTVSPAGLDLAVTDKMAGPQTYPIRIANANPYNNTYDWQAYIDVPWLSLSRSSGEGNSQVSLTMDPQQLVLTNDLNGDGILDGAVGSVTFRSSLMPEPVVLTVSAGVVPSYDLSVHPGQLFWSIEKDDSDQSLALDPQYLQVFSGRTGWTVTTDVHFLTVLAVDLPTTEITDETGALIATQVSTHPYGRVEVTPIAGLIQEMGYGYHTGNITVSDRYSQFFQKIPVTVQIRRPGEPVGMPVSSPEKYQIRPDYIMIETAAAAKIHLQLPVPDSLAYYPTQAACGNAGGDWLDPDGIPGNLNEYCSLSQRVYVLMEFPEMVPGMTYAWNRFGQFSLAYVNGVKTPEADTLTYADGPVPVIPVGPVQLLEYHGSMVISTRIGRNLDAAVETQRIQINIRTPEGRWNVTETYQGQVYAYNNSQLLELYRTPGAPGYFSGAWEGVPVNVVPGDGNTWLHQMEFSRSGIHYIYQIQALSANRMSGKWRFSWPGGNSAWETFEARRQLLPPGFPMP